jgi:hypothetical protein
LELRTAAGTKAEETATWVGPLYVTDSVVIAVHAVAPAELVVPAGHGVADVFPVPAS